MVSKTTVPVAGGTLAGAVVTALAVTQTHTRTHTHTHTLQCCLNGKVTQQMGTRAPQPSRLTAESKPIATFDNDNRPHECMTATETTSSANKERRIRSFYTVSVSLKSNLPFFA